ncbi:uncharacterized protein BDZ99DRAFT_519397 [Mytilinidion resinicola]|uniref:Uncharacterized protein n=1 Tax=Mytilinidion resinicola TaxID=574789 RepID=A0A6A6YPK5_9PEZI|nr:uncharacterized protein BDZ99DRAFT_519397 [Mytilinidion resinicola]KAF2810710.1 hypothetical protein BDZ99DRAFT_519397 [Mytilinidion resinicola]
MTDGSHIGVLRIVPSSLFMIQSESEEIPSLCELKDACSGWLTHYQIFTTEQKPHLTMDISITLDENEVFLHMHQSLWFGTCIPQSPQEVGSLFKIQFPVAIGPSLDAFTVLRDVYKIHAQDNPGLDRSYTASRIAFDFNPDVAQRWQTSYFTTRLAKRMESLIWGCTEDAIPIVAETYAYFLTFTPDERYLLFRDEEERAFVSLVLFELQDPVQGFWSLVAWTQRVLPIGKQVSLSFCQTQPLAAISFEAQVFLWPFKSESPKLFVCRHDAVGPVGRLIDLSECGSYLVIREGSSSPSQVLPVPSCIRRLLSEGEPRARQGAVEIAQGGDLIQFGNNNLSLAGLGIGSGSLIPKNSSIVAADGRAKGIGVVRSSDRVTIQLWESSGASADMRETQVELTKLPEWDCVESAAASIPAPRAGDDEIKVILNKKQRR